MPRVLQSVGRPGTPVVFTDTFRDLRRRQTSAYIATAPVTIILTPHTRTDTATGGWTSTPGTPREPQVFRLSEIANRDDVIQGEAGVQEEAPLIMVGEHDAVIAEDDTFTLAGHEFKVEQLLWTNDFEVRAEVIRLA